MPPGGPSKEYIHAGGKLIATEEPVVASPYYSLSTEGTSAYVDVPNSASLNVTGAVTVEAWIKTNSTGNQSVIERYSGTDGGFILRLWQGKYGFWTVRDWNTIDGVMSSSAITTGVWHHLAGVYDGSQTRLYVDGVLEASKVSAFGPASGSTHVVIGANPDPTLFKFNGLIDESRITASALYSGSFTPQAHLSSLTATRGLWKFDNQTANDSSANGNNGSAMGSASFSTDTPL